MSKAKKRIRVNKNKKKSWNKYSDIRDIDDFLEEKRRDERIGDCLQKPDDEMFFIQTEAENTKECFPSKDKNNLRCFQTLTAYSKVLPPVKSSAGIINKKRKKLLLLRLEKESKRIQNFKGNKNDNVQGGKEAIPTRKFHDMWGGDVKKADPEIADLLDYHDEITKKKLLKVPCHRYQKPSLLPSVEVPHPGSSYNPSYEAHQALLREAVLIEQKKEKEEMHLKRVLTDKFPKKGDTPIQDIWLQEMSEGLFDTGDNKNQEDDNDGNNFVMGNPPVRADDRKTKAKKRKLKERKQEERKRLLMKLDKERNDEIYRLKSIKSQLNQEEVLSQQKQKIKDQRIINKLFQPRTLSCYKYEAPDLEVNLSEEILGTLRMIKTEGNVLEDRFKSLQRRNIIEPRIRQKRTRKYKLKVQIKRSHRDVV